MARNREPILKQCKALGISPMTVGVGKDTKRKVQDNKRRKLSEYGMQLREKQKVKFIYGVLENQFRHYFELAEKSEGVAGTNLLRFLETRLDNVVFRIGLATTRREARQLVTHGHFLVGGQRVDIPSYRVKEGDVITLRDQSKKSSKFQTIVEANHGRITPLWLEVNRETFTAKIVRLPNREDIDFDVEEHLIVELYSK